MGVAVCITWRRRCIAYSATLRLERATENDEIALAQAEEEMSRMNTRMNMSISEMNKLCPWNVSGPVSGTSLEDWR
jgi:hypothetical protein